MSAEAIADAPFVEAWKLRALVYGLLAVVAALVILARVQHDGAVADAGPPIDVPPGQLWGRTSQHASIRIGLRGRDLAWVNVGEVRGYCGGGKRVGVTLYPTFRPDGPGYSRRGRRFEARMRFDFPARDGGEVQAWAWMRGKLSPDRRKATGALGYWETGARGSCRSGDITFTATR